MTKYLFFDDNTDTIVLPSHKIKGFANTAVGTLRIYFRNLLSNADGNDTTVASDYVDLTLTDENSHVAVMTELLDTINSSTHSGELLRPVTVFGSISACPTVEFAAEA
jgi:hypothetical protein